MNEAGIERRLDRLIAIMQLAHADAISRARQTVLIDPVNAAVLEVAAEDWVAAGDLKARVAAETRQSERTVVRRIAQLVALGAVEQTGSGSKVGYRSTGLI